MKKLTLAVAIAMLGTSGAAYAQTSATQSTTATTQIIRAISINPGTTLQFGRIVKPSTGTGTVTVDTSGGRTSGGGATLAGGTATAATYTVNGEGGQNITITHDASVTLTNTTPGAGGGTISASLTSSDADGAATLSNSLGAAGSFGFSIGGTLSIPSAANTGDYTGNFNVVVAYN